MREKRRRGDARTRGSRERRRVRRARRPATRPRGVTGIGRRHFLAPFEGARTRTSAGSRAVRPRSACGPRKDTRNRSSQPVGVVAGRAALGVHARDPGAIGVRKRARAAGFFQHRVESTSAVDSHRPETRHTLGKAKRRSAAVQTRALLLFSLALVFESTSHHTPTRYRTSRPRTRPLHPRAARLADATVAATSPKRPEARSFGLDVLHPRHLVHEHPLHGSLLLVRALVHDECHHISVHELHLVLRAERLPRPAPQRHPGTVFGV